MDGSGTRGVWSTFAHGLAVVLPVVLTAAAVYWLGASLEGALGALIKLALPDVLYVPGMGIAAALALTYAAGLAMRAWAARRLLAVVEGLVERIPLAKSVYGGVRDLIGFVSGTSQPGDDGRVVLVSLADGVRLVGFVTGDEAGLAARAGGDEPCVPVYLQMSYQLGGYTVLVPRSRIEPLEMDMEDATRWVLTAGMSSASAPRATRG